MKLESIKKSRHIRTIASVYFCFHIFAIFIMNIPNDILLKRPFMGVLTPYLQLTGTWQIWNMFTTVPRFHTQKIRIVATQANGQKKEFQPMLPGFTQYEDFIRNHILFIRFFEMSEYRNQLADYKRNVCRALNQANWPSRYFEIFADVEVIPDPLDWRNEISYRKHTKKLGPNRCSPTN